MRALITIAWLLAIPPFSLGADPGAGPAAAPPEVRKALAPVTKIGFQADVRLEDRRQQYLADLEALETGLGESTGDLDRVLLVRKERLSWKANEPTPAMDPKDDAYPLEMRKLRYYFDRDRAELEKALADQRSKVIPSVVAALSNAEEELTRAGRIDAAIAARTAREELEAELAGRETAVPLGSSRLSLSQAAAAIEVSPNGSGHALTLDQALKEAREGDTLRLRPGDYPVSKASKDPEKQPNYVIRTPGLKLIGERAVLPKRLWILASGVEISGIQCPEYLCIGGDPAADPPEDVVVRDCRYFRAWIRDGSKATCVNSVGGIQVDQSAAGTFDHCTILYPNTEARTDGVFQLTHQSESEFTNCVLRGGTVLFRTLYDGPASASLRNCLAWTDRTWLHVVPSGGKPDRFLNDPGDLREYRIRSNRVIFENPGFVDLDGGDYRLKPASPGRGKGDGGRDLGAMLDEDGWPVGE